MTFDEVKKIFRTPAAGYLATCGDKQPDLRGWELSHVENDRFYFCTSNAKNVWKDLTGNPNIGYACEKDGWFLRILGTIVVVKDKAEKMRAFSKFSNDVKGLYKGLEDTELEVFYLEHGIIKYTEGADDPYQILEF